MSDWARYPDDDASSLARLVPRFPSRPDDRKPNIINIFFFYSNRYDRLHPPKRVSTGASSYTPFARTHGGRRSPRVTRHLALFVSSATRTSTVAPRPPARCNSAAAETLSCRVVFVRVSSVTCVCTCARAGVRHQSNVRYCSRARAYSCGCWSTGVRGEFRVFPPRALRTPELSRFGRRPGKYRAFLLFIFFVIIVFVFHPRRTDAESRNRRLTC